FSRQVSLHEIKENDYNLNITRYVNLSKEEEQIDLKAVTKQLKESDRKIEEAHQRLNVYLKELGLEEI
ncbi:MAG: SAM-dependent DNA methyltransferase, partial [Bacteroidales bacterium]|nr:SAM-dependent DNA methyltransferase [Bacteroidales bacterium]